jgi:hypothetical protein
MRRTWAGVPCLGLALIALAGCYSTPQNRMRPPPHEEQYVLPPDDKRFSQPPQYPKEYLNQDKIRKDDDDKAGAPGGMHSGPKMGMGAGPGG